MGWLGPFIMGVSHYVVPRLAGTPLLRPVVAPLAVCLLFAGVATRAIGQGTMGLGIDHGTGPIVIGLSGLVTLVAIFLYVGTAVYVVLRADEQRAALAAVRPLIVAAMVGWLGYGVINVVVSLGAMRAETAMVDLVWNRNAIDVYVALTLVPVALAFSIRTFPLYLRLPPIDWSVPTASFVYVLAALLTFGHRFVPDLDYAVLTGSGHAVKGGILLYFIWKLDVLSRRRPPWTIDRLAEATGGPHPTRIGLPDRGEFGRFELPLYTAYVWLLVAAVLEIVTGVQTIIGGELWVDSDALRHTFLAGFLTTLLFGMAPRMIPGFIHARRVGVPGLVGPAAVLWSVAALLRILPLLLAAPLNHWGVPPAVIAGSFGLSGPIGTVAVLLLAITLFRTRPNESR